MLDRIVLLNAPAALPTSLFGHLESVLDLLQRPIAGFGQAQVQEDNAEKCHRTVHQEGALGPNVRKEGRSRLHHHKEHDKVEGRRQARAQAAMREREQFARHAPGQRNDADADKRDVADQQEQGQPRQRWAAVVRPKQVGRESE